MALIVIPTRTSTGLNAAADINALMENDRYLESEIPNAAWPVGSFYWQAPSVKGNIKSMTFLTEEEPVELFGGTWTRLYSDDILVLGDSVYDEEQSYLYARLNKLFKLWYRTA